MRRYTNYRDLYNHIVRSFYLGEYRKGDRFPTQVELVATYRVAANSIKKVFKLLLDDGFIVTDRSFGTHVTFDLDNPAHVTKVPLHRPDPQGNDIDTLVVPSQFAAYTLCHVLTLATPSQREGYISYIEAMLARLHTVHDLPCIDHSLFSEMCRNLDNRYLTEFSEFLMHEYIFIGHEAYNNAELCAAVQSLSARFYTELLKILRDNQPQRVLKLFPAYYKSLYRLPGLFVFSIPERRHKTFAQQALYTQLMHKLLLFIVSNNLRQGDLLPTERDIATQYGVSIITVRRAMSMLKEIGLVDGERFVGTRMQEDWNSPCLHKWLSQLLEQQRKMISDAIVAEYVIGLSLQNSIALLASDKLTNTMQHMLDLQWEGYQRCNAPLFMSQIFSAPMVSVIDSPLLTHCFYHVHDDLTKFLAIRLLQMSKDFCGEDEVHRCAQAAIDALRVQDFAGFIEQSNAAVLHNWELLRSAIDETVYRCCHSDTN